MSGPSVHQIIQDSYLIERELGRGGMATVFLAQDLKHNRPVALKVLRPELASAVGAERFLREIQIAARLRHRHILPLFDSGTVAGCPYYVMPYVAGESLRERLRREGPLPLEDALRIACDIANALDYAHAQGVVHRDIKPENLMLEGGAVLVADFGIARAIGNADLQTLTETGLVIGTPTYMSPEQVAGERKVDGRSDIYSLGCVLYEMLTGAPPFLGPTSHAIMARHTMDPVPPVHTVRPQVPTGVEAAVEKALAKMPADRFGSAADFAAALERGSKTQPWRRRRWSRALVALGTGVLVVAAATTIMLRRGQTSLHLDTNLLAVAPFDILDPELAMWREGLVDVLAANINGAGQLRTVSPTIVLRSWSGRADPASALALGRRLHAGLAVYGRLVGAGPDSLRLSATLLDVSGGAALGEFEVRGAVARMDAVIDSVTLELLRQLGRTRAVGTVRRAALGFRSLPGLKAYLQGEQFFRRSQWDSALVYYGRALSQDTTSALALWRLSQVEGWAGTGGDPNMAGNAVRTGALNHGLAPRESLLIASWAQYGKSIGAQSGEVRFPSPWWAYARQLLSTSTEIQRRYPDDPDAAAAVSEYRYFFGSPLGRTVDQTMADADHAIALDSGFAPNYLYSIQSSALPRTGVAGLRKSLAAYLALDPPEPGAGGFRLAATLLDPRKADLPETARTIDTMSADGLFLAYTVLEYWYDSSETAVQLARLFEHGRHSEVSLFRDAAFRRQVLWEALVERGHFREAFSLLGTSLSSHFGDLVLQGAVPRDSAATVYAHWLRVPPDPPELMETALWYWSESGDTASLRRFADQASTAARAATDPDWRAFRGYLRDAAGAYLALARHDTSEALSRLRELPDTACPTCVVPDLTRIRLLLAVGNYAAAAQERGPPYDPYRGGYRLRIAWALERARALDHTGSRPEAVRNYQIVADGWSRGDSELQPYVSEARTALRRLTGN